MNNVFQKYGIKKSKKVVKGGYLIGEPDESKLIYSNVAFGYNPNLGGNHYYRGNLPKNQPYITWIKQNPWMIPFGKFAEREDTGDKTYTYEQFLKDKPELISRKQAVLNQIKAIQAKYPPDYVPGQPWWSKEDMEKVKQLGFDLQHTTGTLDIMPWKKATGVGFPNVGNLRMNFQLEWLAGNDDTQRNIYHYGSHDWLWAEANNPEHILTDENTETARQCGTAWCIMYNRSWQTGERDSNRWEDALDAIKKGFEIGKTVAELVV